MLKINKLKQLKNYFVLRLHCMSNDKTLQTEENYLKRGQLFCQKIARLKGIAEEHVTADMLLNFFLEHHRSYAKATFRQYKASLLFFIKEKNLDPTGDVYNYLCNLTADECENNTRKTSNLKRKQITDEQFNRFLYALSCIPSYWQNLSIKWLFFGAMTGLRPCEWQGANLLYDDSDKESSHWVLSVRNRKNTNNRSHGMYRSIHLTDISENNLNDLKSFLNTFKSFIEAYGYTRTYVACKRFINKVNGLLIKGKMNEFGFDECTGSGIYRQDHLTLRITLYSARHFFSSRAKTYLDRISVAALMGHKNNVTAFEHYGRASKHYSARSKVRPDEKDVLKVEVKEEKHQWYEQKQQEKMQKQKENAPKTTVTQIPEKTESAFRFSR